jgi:hypothetical protein
MVAMKALIRITALLAGSALGAAAGLALLWLYYAVFPIPSAGGEGGLVEYGKAVLRLYWAIGIGTLLGACLGLRVAKQLIVRRWMPATQI